MDLKEETIKEEVSNFVYHLQKILPSRKEILDVIQIPQPKLGRLTDIHAEAKNVFPMCFIGAKLMIMREIMDKVKLSQRYSYGRPKEPYKCFSKFLYKELEPKRTEQMLVVDTSASATATYRKFLDDNYEMTLTSKIRDLVCSETKLVFEKNDSTYYGALTCVMKDVDPTTIRIVSQWMQQVIPGFSVGLEVGFKPLSYPPIPDISVSARYEQPAYTLSSTVSKSGFQVCCFKNFSEDVQVAAILNEANEGSATLGMAMKKVFAKGSEIKMFMDSERCVGLTYQKDVFVSEGLDDMRVLRITVSSLIDRQRRMRFGVGFNVDF